MSQTTHTIAQYLMSLPSHQRGSVMWIVVGQRLPQRHLSADALVTGAVCESLTEECRGQQPVRIVDLPVVPANSAQLARDGYSQWVFAPTWGDFLREVWEQGGGEPTLKGRRMLHWPTHLHDVDLRVVEVKVLLSSGRVLFSPVRDWSEEAAFERDLHDLSTAGVAFPDSYPARVTRAAEERVYSALRRSDPARFEEQSQGWNAAMALGAVLPPDASEDFAFGFQRARRWYPQGETPTPTGVLLTEAEVSVLGDDLDRAEIQKEERDGTPVSLALRLHRLALRYTYDLEEARRQGQAHGKTQQQVEALLSRERLYHQTLDVVPVGALDEQGRPRLDQDRKALSLTERLVRVLGRLTDAEQERDRLRQRVTVLEAAVRRDA